MRANFNEPWQVVQQTEGAVHWTAWIALSSNQSFRRFCESGRWFLWDTTQNSWSPVDVKQLPKDLIPCSSWPADAHPWE